MSSRGVREPLQGDRAVKLTALTTTKIEADVSEEFTRHTLRFVDRVIVVDNGSLDATREILAALASEGLPLTVWAGEAVPVGTNHWTALARRALCDFETDYLLLVDVDEFVRAPSRAALEASLEMLAGTYARVPWVTYVPRAADDRAEPRTLVRKQYRSAVEYNVVGKLFVHRSFAEAAGASIRPGNHGIVGSDGRAVAHAAPAGVQLAFPRPQSAANPK